MGAPSRWVDYYYYSDECGSRVHVTCADYDASVVLTHLLVSALKLLLLSLWLLVMSGILLTTLVLSVLLLRPRRSSRSVVALTIVHIRWFNGWICITMRTRV